jgi:hypothetical protein
MQVCRRMTMTNREQRKALSQALRRLVTGRMSNDDFDDLFHDGFEESEDAAVKEIAVFCYGLYSSDTLLPYRLQGRHRVSAEVRQMACRCVLFLQSDLEYEWPPYRTEAGRQFLWFVAFNLGLPGSIACLLVSSMLLASRDYSFAAQLGVPAVIVLLLSIWALFVMPRSESPEQQTWKSMGDWDAWPFIRQCDLDKQNRP